jgi:hypothetical protein
MRFSMHTNILKWVPIAVLLLVGLRLPAVVLFNPVVPVGLAGNIFLWLEWVCLAAFLVSFAASKRQRALSLPS